MFEERPQKEKATGLKIALVVWTVKTSVLMFICVVLVKMVISIVIWLSKRFGLDPTFYTTLFLTKI